MSEGVVVPRLRRYKGSDDLPPALCRTPDKKRCSGCLTVQPSDEFSKHKYVTTQGKAGTRLDSRCKTCRAIAKRERDNRDREATSRKAAEWRSRNIVHVRDRNNKYKKSRQQESNMQRVRSERRRRVWRLGGVTEDGVEDVVLSLARVGDKYLDAYSGDLIDKPTFDHIVPLSTGGHHIYDNLCVTSGSNNSSKRNVPLLIWLVRRRQREAAL